MCKLAYYRTKEKDAYNVCVNMIKHQENVVAGHSTSLTWKDNNGFNIRKAIGKINSFLAKYPDKPSTYECMGHTRYATIGEINLDNQHPIPIIVHGKTIGYGIHNGTFTRHNDYEYLRTDIKNKTDSALLFIMFGKLLERIGDSTKNRCIALSYISELTNDQNFIVMFRNDLVLFAGSVLTYKVTEDSIGVMTFGYKNKCDSKTIYLIQGNNLHQYPKVDSPFKFKPKPPIRQSFKKKTHNWGGWDYDYSWGGFR